MPLVCQREATSLIKKPVEQRIAKANRWIRETKEHFRLPNARGLLLFANDGNYLLEAENIIYFISKVLNASCSSIHSVIVFTANMPSLIPGIEQPANIWISGHRKLEEGVSDVFLDRIKETWMACYAEATGQQVRLYNREYGNISEIRLISH